MAIGKEIRTKISSINSTRKITSAMELVAASKMRKVQDRMVASQPYTRNMRTIIRHLAQANVEYRHPYLTARPLRKVGVLVVSSDRGLCGGLNINLFKHLIERMKQWRNDRIDTELAIFGNKGNAFFKRFGAPIIGAKNNLGDTPDIEVLISVVNLLLIAYQEEKIDALYIASNDFINTMTQQPRIEQLLPLIDQQEKESQENMVARWDYLYEGDIETLIEALLARYIEALVYQAVIENNACEQAARMIAMKSATDNASELISDLKRVYNKARQAAITQEISEIVGGAEAL